MPLPPQPAAKRNHRFHRLDDTGGYTIEAAIVLPLFVLAVMTIAFLIRVIGLEGSVMQIAADEAGRLAVDSYSVRSGILFEPVLKARIYEECEDVVRCDTKRYQYLTVHGGQDGIILCTLKTEAQLPVPFPLAKPPSFRKRSRSRRRGNWLSEVYKGQRKPDKLIFAFQRWPLFLKE